MSKFERSLDDAVDQLKTDLRRGPLLDEIELLRQQLFQSWLIAQRFDDLIDYIHEYYKLDGGFGDCSILSEALRKKGDLERIERLFHKLIVARTSAFWRVWPQAGTGHIGAMRESAMYMAKAMEAYAGLWHGYWSLDDEAGKKRIQEEMLQLQQRIKPKANSRRSGSKRSQA